VPFSEWNEILSLEPIDELTRERQARAIITYPIGARQVFSVGFCGLRGFARDASVRSVSSCKNTASGPAVRTRGPTLRGLLTGARGGRGGNAKQPLAPDFSTGGNGENGGVEGLCFLRGLL
jgi:hypothetical protein